MVKSDSLIPKNIEAMLVGAGINPLTSSIIEVLLQPAVQHHLFGMRKGAIKIIIKDEICVAIEPAPELRRAYEIFPR